MNTSRLPECLARLAAVCGAFLADERGSAVLDYAALTAVTCAVGIWTERRVGRQVAQMFYQVAEALPG